jgi:hypothetical protein
MDHKITCAWCKSTFTTSGRRDTKYCSQQCKLKNKDSKRDRTVYYQANKVRLLEERRKRYQHEKLDLAYKAKQRKYYWTYSKERMANDVNYKLKKRLRTRLYSALTQNVKIGSAVSDLGCSIEELKTHLESQFQQGMSWDNWGIGPGTWQIDHIKRLAGFNLADPIQLKNACHYTNLQPLWFEDHLLKSAKEESS